MRFRSYNGFIDISEASKEWLLENPEFSIYERDIQVGRIFISTTEVEVEVLEEGFEDTLNHTAVEIYSVIKEQDGV